MIFIGAYPDSFETENSSTKPLQVLEDILARVAPANVGLHLLPFTPHSGDGGFASNNWFRVRRGLGSWKDIRAIAASRKLLVDGIYNHVGVGHPFARKFFASPEVGARLIHASSCSGESDLPRSPRGGPARRRHLIQQQTWFVWQTHSLAALDIRLDSPEVQEEIDRHLSFLADHGSWGIRLDSPAYYGKQVGVESNRHLPDAYRFARVITDKAIAHGLVVAAQLDCDPKGLEYFPRNLGYDIPVVDYAYCSYLVHALLERNPSEFAKHLERTWQIPQTLMRVPRTHDGILLRSKNLDPHVKSVLLCYAQRYNLSLRSVDGSPYELNSSFPYLCSLGVGPEQMRSRIDLAVAITGFLPGWSYFYLPALIGHIPERSVVPADDPRLLNRQRIPLAVANAYLQSNACSSTFDLLAWLAAMHKEYGEKEEFSVESVACIGSHLLSIKRASARIQLLANFDCTNSVSVANMTSGQWIGGHKSTADVVEPLGFGFWKY